MIVVARYPRPLKLALAGLATTFATAASLLFPGHPLLVGLGVLASFLALAIRSEVRLDPRRRRYRWTRGFWPWFEVREGSLEELRSIQVDAIKARVAAAGGGWSDDAHNGFVISLVGNRDGVSFGLPVFRSLGFRHASRAALRLAEGTGLPIVETPAMERYRKQRRDETYTHRLQ
ncbi:MAG: hypothetical protein ACO1SV_03370 [Fimbriimonas sp.]